MASSSSLVLRVRIEQGIPKLLVKVNPNEAEGLAAKNLGEVTLKKHSAARGRVAVLHLSHTVTSGELLMSLKLAELLDVEEDECVEICAVPEAETKMGRSHAPSRAHRAPPPGGRPSLSAALGVGSTSAAGGLGLGQLDPTQRRSADPLARAPLGASNGMQLYDGSGYPRANANLVGGSTGTGSSGGYGQATTSSANHLRAPMPTEAVARDPLRGYRPSEADARKPAEPETSGPGRATADIPRRKPGEPEAFGTGRTTTDFTWRPEADRPGLGRDRAAEAPPKERRGSDEFRQPRPRPSTDAPLSFGVHADAGQLPGRGGGLVPGGRASDEKLTGHWSKTLIDWQSGTGRKTPPTPGANSSTTPTEPVMDDLPYPRTPSVPTHGDREANKPSFDRLTFRQACQKRYDDAGAQLNERRKSDGLLSAYGGLFTKGAAKAQASTAPAPAPTVFPPTHPTQQADRAYGANIPSAVRRDVRRPSTGVVGEKPIWDPSKESQSWTSSPKERTASWSSASAATAGAPAVAEAPPPPAGARKTSEASESGASSFATAPAADRGAEVNALPQATQAAAPQPDSRPGSSPSASPTVSPLASPPATPVFTAGAAPAPGAGAGGGGSSKLRKGKAKRAFSMPPPDLQLPLALVPVRSTAMRGASVTPASSSSKKNTALRRAKTIQLGALLQSELPAPIREPPEPRQPLPLHWLPPWDSGSGLERSELGPEITTEVRRWLLGETTGQQCSQVVLDRALTVLSNFKLASGVQLEVLGGPLGAIVGGYSDADWLFEEVFCKQPAEAVQDAFELLGFKQRADGDWSGLVAEEVSLAYRRQCLRGHPSRGGSPRTYLKLQVAMELVRAFAGEAGPLEASKDLAECFVLNDVALAKELELTAKQAEEEASRLPTEQLEEMNRALDEYILRQMCFKSEIVDEIARLHEDSAYAILGISSGATDAEIKRAYRNVAMQCHPDKGGDKEEFQELNNAYERIMEQRRQSCDDKSHGKDASDEDIIVCQPPPAKQAEPEEAEAGKDKDGTGGEEGKGAEKGDGEKGDDDDDDDANLVEKASKAAEEASRYAKTAAEFAHQAADAAETARQGRESGNHDTLTKSVAHSAIVLTLTVVKAVRVVGYATLDVAAQCRAAAKRNPKATECSDKSVTAMSLGLEALNSALSCAEVTETTAAELQAPAPKVEDNASTQAAERFVNSAVRASLAAAAASNAAMSAAIAAVEGSRQCMQAMQSKDEGNEGEGDADKAEGDEDQPEEAKDEADAETANAEEAEEPPEPKKTLTAEEKAANAVKRLVSQRHNNHKVLHRLNSEILGHQRNVRLFLQQNRQLIPAVSGESKWKVMDLLQGYAKEARLELENALFAPGRPSGAEVLEALSAVPMLVPFLQPQKTAIPVSVKARVLKMASLYDLPLSMKVLNEQVFAVARNSLPQDDVEARAAVDALLASIRSEICSNVAEEPSEPGGATPVSGSGGTAQSPVNFFGSSDPSPTHGSSVG